MSRTKSISRRKFLVATGVAGGGLILGLNLGCTPVIPHTREGSFQPNAWLQITPDGQVIFQLTKTEMGQGVFSSLPTVLAEELDYDPKKITIEMAGIHPEFADPATKVQLTGGSNSIASNWLVLREAGAGARAMLVAAAAKRWQISEKLCSTDDGQVISPDNNRLSYGELANDAAKVGEIDFQLKPASQFRWIGKPDARLDSVAKSTGTAQFGMDIVRPNMKIAVVVRPPYFGGAVQSWDAGSVSGADGVNAAFAIHSGIAIVADSYWQARKAAKQLVVKWDKGPLAGLDSEAIRKGHQTALAEGEPHIAFEKGQLAPVIQRSQNVVQAEYASPFAHHSPMEPQNATAIVTGKSCEIWAPSQTPDMSRALAAHFSGLNRDNITVHTPFLGGGFGRRGYPDFVGEVAAIAVGVPGTAIKLIWSREDDMQHDFYRPATYHGLQGALDEKGRLLAWQHKVVSTSIIQGLGVNLASTVLPSWVPSSTARSLGKLLGDTMAEADPTTAEGAHIPYDADNISIEQVLYDPGIRNGFWRSVGFSHNCFASESFMDEMAHKAGTDPVQFRLKHLAQSLRHINVLKLAAEKAQWGSPTNGLSQGVAVTAPFDSYCAMVADVSVQDKQYTIERIVAAVDCGIVINPDIVQAQVESAIIYGLTAATKAPVTIKDGAVEQSNFHDLPVMRINEIPLIEVYLVSSNEKPTGIGEIGVPGVAPALANALFAATGQRLREMPLILS
jgi:isoquinoline 1-oxidoreductase subunit beta